MTMISLTEAKTHLRVDQDADDAAIVSMINAAEAATADYLNLTLADLEPSAPAPVKAAALLLVADLYENRERQNSEPLYRNQTYERLLNPYRQMGV